MEAVSQATREVVTDADRSLVILRVLRNPRVGPCDKKKERNSQARFPALVIKRSLRVPVGIFPQEESA